MPRIQTYDAGQVGTQGPIGQRRAVAEDFGGGALASDFGRQAGEIGDLLAQREDRADVSAVSASLANAQAEQGAYLQELLRTADPSDPQVAEKFLEQFDAYTGKLGENVKTRAGREYFQKTVGTLRGYYFGRALEGQAQLAGQQAVLDYQTILNQQSSALINDPAAFDITMALHGESVDNLVATSGMSRITAEELKTKGATELAKAAVLGTINLNPHRAKEILASGELDSFIEGTLKEQLNDQADQAIEGQRIEAERARAAADRAKQQAQMVEQNEMLEKLVTGDLTPQDVLASGLDPFGEGGKNTYLNLIKTQIEGGDSIKTDSGTFIALWDRIHLPDGHPDKLVNENDLNQFLGRGLKVEDINTLRTEMQGSRTSAGAVEDVLKNGLIQAAKTAITGTDPLLGLRDPKGDEQLQKFMAWLLPEYQRLRAEGKSVLTLTDPESPDYLGKAISRYTRPRAQMLKDLMGDNPTTVGVDGAEAPTAADVAAGAAPLTMATPNPPGLVEAGNLDLMNRPEVRDASGGIQTVHSISFNLDGVEVLIPTVTKDGRLLSNREAIEEYRRTGEFLGKFDTPEHATEYAKLLHRQQAVVSGNYTATGTLNGRKIYAVDEMWVFDDGSEAK